MNEARFSLRAAGQRIRWAREHVEPDPAAFARGLNLEPALFAAIEAGKVEPRMTTLWLICHSLRLSLDYVVAGWLRGVDPELAALLCAHHPDLLDHSLRADAEHPDLAERPWWSVWKQQMN